MAKREPQQPQLGEATEMHPWLKHASAGISDQSLNAMEITSIFIHFQLLILH